MQYIKMSYKGVVFNVNPSGIKISMKKGVSRRTVPFGTSRAQEISTMPVVISGEGTFTGSDAFERAQELMRVFDDKGSAYLFLPDAMAMKAYFNALDISYDAAKNRVDYTFAFTRDYNGRSNVYNPGFTKVKRGENLYDIANRCNVRTDNLFISNDFKDMFSVKEGDRVWLN